MRSLYFTIIMAFSIADIKSQINVTFSVDMTNYLQMGDSVLSGGIRIMGNFQALGAQILNWNVNNQEGVMENIPFSNIWQTTIEFPSNSAGQELGFLFHNGESWGMSEGTIGVSLIVDGVCGIVDPNLPDFVVRKVLIPNQDTAYCYFWDSCQPCFSLDDNNRIEGHVFLDLNGNQTKDDSEPNISNVFVKVFENGNLVNTSITGMQGNYIIPATQGDKLVTVELTEQYTSVSSSQNINFPSSNGDIEIVNFPLELSSTYHDLEIIASLDLMIAGFDGVAQIKVKNNGNIANNLTVTIQIPDHFTINNTAPSATITGNTLTWNINQINALTTQNFSILYNISPPPLYMPGDFVEWLGNVSTVENESITLNNSFRYSLPIFTSYDPNDKTMMRGQSLTPAQANNGNPFIYRIRFQNNGNFPAQFIHVRDTLELGLDANTIRTLDASHDCSLNIIEGRYLDWFFPNIQLPDSLSDPEGSQGYILFSVMPVLPLNLGDSIHNTAHIYFDFNPAVVTNKEVTKIELPSQIKNLDKWELQAFYNVMSDKISIKGLTSEVSEVRLISVSGQLIHFWNRDFDNMKVNQINSGIYIVQIISKGESKAVRLMINR